MRYKVKQPWLDVEALEPRTHLSVARPAYDSGTGFFTLNGKLYDSNGNEFVMKGPNAVHAWGSYVTNYNTIDQIAKTGANAARLVTYRDLSVDSGNPWTDAADTVPERKEVIERYLANGIVPIIEDHASIADGGSVQSSPTALSEIVTHWLDNASWLKQYEQYIILNICNEWGPPATANGSNTVWRDSYVTQVQRLRAGPDGNLATTADNINCAIMIDSGSWGQDLYTIEQYADDVLAADPQHNIVFSIHLYGSWRDESRSYELSTNPSAGWGPWDISTRLNSWVTRADPLTIAIGEFAYEDFKDFSSTSGPYGAYRTRRVLQIADQIGVGWLGWSWNGSSPNTLNMTTGVSNFTYNSNTELSRWGDLLVNDPVYGMKASARRASFFPVTGLPAPTTAGLAALPANPPSDTWLVLESAVVGIPEGGSGIARVRLSKQPASDVVVTLNKASGDVDLNLATTTLTFTPSNWSTFQNIQVTAASDVNSTADTARFTVVAPGLVTTDFSAKEIEPPASQIGNTVSLAPDRDRLLGPATTGTAAAVTVTSTFYTPENNPDATGTMYLRFPASSVAGNITNATLRVYTTNTTASRSVRVFAVLGDSWLESSGTGSNTTPIYASYPLVPDGGAAGYPLPTSGGSYIDITSAALTEYVKGEVLRDGFVSLAIRMVSGTASFQTREGANAPQLVVRSNEAVPPTIVASSFDSSTGSHAINISFSENVEASVSSSDLVVQNLTSPGSTPIVLAPSYNALANTASFTFSPAVIPDGRYLATLSAGAVSDVAGNPMLTGTAVSFAFLLGDADSDLAVNLADFTRLASTFGGPGNYSQGDFNYDGNVSLADFTILASQFGKVLPPIAARAQSVITKQTIPGQLFGVRSIGGLADVHALNQIPANLRERSILEELR